MPESKIHPPAELVKLIATAAGITQAKAHVAITTLFEHILATDRTTIRGFGVFEYREYKPRQFRDPRNTSLHTVAARRQLKLRATKKD